MIGKLAQAVVDLIRAYEERANNLDIAAVEREAQKAQREVLRQLQPRPPLWFVIMVYVVFVGMAFWFLRAIFGALRS